MAVAAKPRVLHACARCGRRQTADRMVYSSHTGSRYCADIDACGRRANKRST